MALAEAAISLRWDEGREPVTPAQVLTVRRSADQGNDAFTTLNVVQENILKGGLRGRDSSGNRRKTRAVSSIDENTRLNKALWRLTEEMARIKGAI
jgi:hypothetical protein